MNDVPTVEMTAPALALALGVPHQEARALLAVLWRRGLARRVGHAPRTGGGAGRQTVVWRFPARVTLEMPHGDSNG